MRSRRVRQPALGLALCIAALASSACFGGGPSAQPTSTAVPAPTLGAGPPAAPAIPSPSPLASPVASPTPVRATGPEQIYTVEPGDTLNTIAQKFYGDPTLWRKIYDANKSAIGENPDAIKVGTQIRIPPKD